MIDPKNIIKYDRTDKELIELAIFCICVAGKSAKTIAPRIDRLCNEYKVFNTPYLAHQLKGLGVGCYRQKANTVRDLLNSNISLRHCEVEDLESIKGIGPKTARFFINSSRPNTNFAVLDTHILKFLRDKGYDVPKSTPSGKRYLELEQLFLSLVPDGQTVAEFDLEIWKKYSQKVDSRQKNGKMGVRKQRTLRKAK